MQKQLRRVSLVIAVMFLALFVSATTIQVISADSLTADQRNVRSVYDSYETLRGAILVDGQPIASSKRTDDQYHYVRDYLSPRYSAITGFFSQFNGQTGIESASNDYLTGKNSSQFFEQINALFSGNSVITHSVVKSRPEIEEAFCSALRVTLVGSITPALTRSS
jgi:peptidoglycan glycosyltransferase